jgi:2-keto-4-pentenoate hydratase
MRDRDPWARAMERQLARWRDARSSGMPRAGWKIGINVPEVQARLGLAHPLVGWIDGRRVYAGGARLDPSPGTKWHVEPELAIRLARAVDPEAGADAAQACVGAIAPALEIVDYALPAGGLGSVVEHCMFHAGCVVGAYRPVELATGLGVHWPLLRVGGEAGPPARPDLVPSQIGELIQLAAALLAGFGEGLEAGDLLLSGSYADRAVALPSRTEARADFGALGEVSLSIA